MPTPLTRQQALWMAFALALGAAVSLGLARFAYALLLPPMRADLGWSYATAGAMNTVNAAGYLLGALMMPAMMRRFSARACLLAGGAGAVVLLAAHGWARNDAPLYALRLSVGVASAWMFVSGGVLAARLSAAPLAPGLSGAWLLSAFYGGTGFGIVAASVVVPPVALAAEPRVLGLSWPHAWGGLGALALIAWALMFWKARIPEAAASSGGSQARALPPFALRAFTPGLLGYLCFGLGYIGYMTFIITLLRDAGLSVPVVSSFFALLGAMVVASPWLWGGLLQRHASGRPMAVLNTLTGLAALLPVLSTHPVVVFASGALFGACFLQVVASTTALVRHNAAPNTWPQGIAAFTAVFAAGQIAGPALTGWLADWSGGLQLGLAASAGILLLGGALGSFQRAH
jgi:predicted MFS family arabinose efflux permease